MTTCPQGHQTSAEDWCDVCGAPVTAAPAPAPAPSAPVPPAPPAAPQTRDCPHCGAANVADALFCEACGYDFTTGTMPRPEASSIPTPTRPDELDEPAPAPAADAPPAGPDAGAAPGTHVLPAPRPSTPGPSTPGPSTQEPPAAAPAAPAVAAPPAAPPPAAPAPGASAPGASTSSAPGPSTPSGGAVEWVAELWIDPDWYALQDSADPMPSPGLPEVVPLRGRSLLVGRVSRSRGIHPDIDCEADSGVSRRQAQLTTDGTRWFVEDLQSANGTFLGPAGGPLPADPVTPGQRVEVGAHDRLYVGAWTRMVLRRAAPGEVEALG